MDSEVLGNKNIMNDSRSSWDKYFLSFLPVIASRSTCNRGKAACLIVKDKRIISTGYAGSISGLPHCDEVGHLLVKQINNDNSINEICVRTVHCEQNAIAQAVRNGVSTEGATIYLTMEPCFSCAKLLIQAGIKRVVCVKLYHNAQLSRKLFDDAKLEFVILSKEEEKY